MLNEAPKKHKDIDYAHPTRMRLFWRIQWECFRRAVTPYLMYLFMSSLALVCQVIVENDNSWLEILLGTVCILIGAVFNGHLCYHYGKMHYGAFVAGETHRRNEAFGIQSGGDHRPEREYRAWKGALIGFYVSVPAIILGIIAGSIPSERLMQGSGIIYMLFVMFAGWAILPITWFGTAEGGVGLAVSPYWSIAMIALPILVSLVLYNVGAYMEKREREQQAARNAAIEEAGNAAAEEVRREANKGKKK